MMTMMLPARGPGCESRAEFHSGSRPACPSPLLSLSESRSESESRVSGRAAGAIRRPSPGPGRLITDSGPGGVQLDSELTGRHNVHCPPAVAGQSRWMSRLHVRPAAAHQAAAHQARLPVRCGSAARASGMATASESDSKFIRKQNQNY
jgi:hypothetical protein